MKAYATLLIVAVLAFFLGSIRPAAADKTIVITSGTGKVDTVCVQPLPDGGAGGWVRGFATPSGGGPDYQSRQDFPNLTGSARTSALSLMNAARPAWEAAEGI